MAADRRYDICVVGAGLVGLATARGIAERLDGASILVLDKEDQIAAHQSSHNSGVVHSGLYYKPGSLKARLCVEGRASVYEICEAEGIPVDRSGKLVIATDPDEMPALEELERRGKANGLIGLTRLGPDGIRDHEPEATGIDALHVPEAGVADFPALAAHLSERLRADGAEIKLGHAVTGIEHRADGVLVTATGEQFSARCLVNCAGLHSDRVAALALGREQYRGVGPVWTDLRDVLASRGFRRLARRHWLSGTRELLSSRSRRLYARLARRLVPATRPEHLIEGGAGVRAQAVRPDGSLVDDFVIEKAGASIHVLNAPSPGATASLAIGRYIAAQAEPLLAG